MATHYLCHHHNNIDNIPSNIDVLVYGHFHTGFIKEKDGVLCINSGSVSLPKNDTRHSYMIYENNKFVWKDLNSLEEYMKYERGN